jgi:hypothetical protein
MPWVATTEKGIDASLEVEMQSITASSSVTNNELPFLTAKLFKVKTNYVTLTIIVKLFA